MHLFACVSSGWGRVCMCLCVKAQTCWWGCVSEWELLTPLNILFLIIWACVLVCVFCGLCMCGYLWVYLDRSVWGCKGRGVRVFWLLGQCLATINQDSVFTFLRRGAGWPDHAPSPYPFAHSSWPFTPQPKCHILWELFWDCRMGTSLSFPDSLLPSAYSLSAALIHQSTSSLPLPKRIKDGFRKYNGIHWSAGFSQACISLLLELVTDTSVWPIRLSLCSEHSSMLVKMNWVEKRSCGTHGKNQCHWSQTELGGDCQPRDLGGNLSPLWASVSLPMKSGQYMLFHSTGDGREHPKRASQCSICVGCHFYYAILVGCRVRAETSVP